MINAFSFCKGNDKIECSFYNSSKPTNESERIVNEDFSVNAHIFCDYLVSGKAFLNCNIFLLEISAYYILLVNK